MKFKPLPKLKKPAVIILVALAILITAGLTGCTLASLINKQPNETVDNAPNESRDEADKNKDVEDKVDDKPKPIIYYHVLTGLETTRELAGLRPVSVCIANSIYSLPQEGIGDAQILVEMPLENGTTRLMLLTNDYRQTATIGGVQSSRSYLMKVANAFNAIQCFRGTDDTVSSDTLGLYDTLDYVSKKLVGVYYEDDTRTAPGELMTNGILLENAIRKNEFDTSFSSSFKMPFQFAPVNGAVSLGGGRAATVSIGFSNDLTVTYQYNRTTGQYQRSQYGEAHLDGGTGKQVAFDNVFVLFASSVTYEKENSKSLDLVMEDNGTGYYMNGGQYEAIRWEMNADGTMTFLDAEGKTLVVNRGTSYIGFVKAGDAASVNIR